MISENQSVLIEIPEDAYKQNTVYRPWSEIEASEPADESGVRQSTAMLAVIELLSA